MELKRVVLDTTAFVFLNDFSRFEEAYSVQEVVKEVKDRLSIMKLESMTKDLKIVEPDEKTVEYVKEVAKDTGDLKKLSETDVKVIAAAKQMDCTIVSDDYNIQNMAGHIGIKYVSTFNPSIKKLKKWDKKLDKEGRKKVD